MLEYLHINIVKRDLEVWYWSSTGYPSLRSLNVERTVSQLFPDCRAFRMALQPREGPSTAFLWPPFRRLGHVETIYCNPIWVHLASFVSHLLMGLKAVGKLCCIAIRTTEYRVPRTYLIHRSRFSSIIVAIGSVQGLRLPLSFSFPFR